MVPLTVPLNPHPYQARSSKNWHLLDVGSSHAICAHVALTECLLLKCLPFSVCPTTGTKSVIGKGVALLTEGNFSQRKCAVEDLKDLNSISRKFLVSSMTLDQPLFWAPLPLCVIRVGSLRSRQQPNTERHSFMYYANCLRSIVIPGL